MEVYDLPTEQTPTAVAETVVSQIKHLQNTAGALSDMADRYEGLAMRVNGSGKGKLREERPSAPVPTLVMVPSLVDCNGSLLKSSERLQLAFDSIQLTLGV